MILTRESRSKSLEDYVALIESRCEATMKLRKKPKELSDDAATVPRFDQYQDIADHNYNVQQLKQIAKQYKLKVSGNKPQLVSRLFVYLKLSASVITIQKIFRGIIRRMYDLAHGPAFFNRALCTNPYDFLTIEPMAELAPSQFFSYQDLDGFVYGFDIISLYNLIEKGGKNAKNPYNRNDIPGHVLVALKQLMRLSTVLKIKIDINIRDISQDITNEKSTELKILDVFQTIDSLGNYSDPAWFTALNRQQMLKFVRELHDIWDYRAQISAEVKRNICPPNGDPFRILSANSIISESNMVAIRKIVLPLLEKLVNTGVDKDSRSLGAYYVLGGLTLVSQDAADALPWLYQSVSYF